MANGIALDTAAIVSTVLEGILYGISLLMFVGTTLALVDRRLHSGVASARMMTVACALLLFSSVHLVIDVVRTCEGLILYRDAPQFGGPTDFFSDVSQWSFVSKNVMYMFQTLVGDGVVIYRCYVVWQRWWVTIFPIVLWVSVAVTGIGCVFFDAQANVDRENIFAPSTGPWITSFLAATLLTNIVSTSLLAFRIWNVGKRARRDALRESVLWPVLRVVLDAGVLYSVSLLAALLCFVGKNRGHYVLIDMIMPIISITFYMVLLRVTLAKPNSQGIAQQTQSGSVPPMFSRGPPPSLPMERAYAMRRMEVHISRLTETGIYGCVEHGWNTEKEEGEGCVVDGLERDVTDAARKGERFGGLAV